MPTSRPNTQVETLLAMVKRNLNVPDLMGVTDIPALADSMFDAFVSTYIGDNGLASGFERMPILPNPRSLSEWLVTQPPNVVDQISCDLPLHERRLDRYDFMIKSTVKPQLDTNAPYVYSALQTIAYQTKDINAIFCPIFKEMKKRLLSVLGKRFRIYCDVSPEEFAEDLTNSFQPEDEFAFFSGDDSLIRDAIGRYLEIDFSKYDKSQGLLALLLT
ncbi:hypothetical protein LSTR_LSTR014790 [Laodelphax striatellus]|uniref:RNA-dependent RNA polymerase alsuviricetes domain-containing protein n=1 Tax=Laodelphax striatellus TaxID=195883 RepID=A0A482WPC6_LAOST|nr:hypothetical protein LSTR_LSTR014790 [Laodelphax striatellus]